jgi:ankyrin repeat protein
MSRPTHIPWILFAALAGVGIWAIIHLALLPAPTERLFAAVAADDLEGVRRAIGQGAHLETLAPSGADLPGVFAGQTPLILATIRGQPDLAAALLECGAQIDTEDSSGRMAIHYAVRRRGQAPVLRVLLDAGADPNTLTPPAGRSPSIPLLYAAVQLGDESMVGALLEAGADPSPDLLGRPCSSVAIAMEGGLEQLIDPLLAAGARVDVAPPSSSAPLLGWVAEAGRADLAEKLLRAGADPAAMTIQGEPALHALWRRHGDRWLDLVTAIERDGAGLDLLGMTWLMRADTALMHAAAAGSPWTVRMLREADAAVDASNDDGDTALDLARRRLDRDPEIAQEIVRELEGPRD